MSKVDSCRCATPLPVERAEHNGAAWTPCARCYRPVPVLVHKARAADRRAERAA